MNRFLVIGLLAPWFLPAFGGEADVLDVNVSCDPESVCRFDVTVKHNDAGWSHYANRWEILAPDGTVLATRVLAHPHDDEQPFTRSLGNVEIPDGISVVTIKAHDLVHEYGGKELTVQLPDQALEPRVH